MALPLQFNEVRRHWGLALRQYAVFSGRAGPAEYWWFALPVWLVTFFVFPPALLGLGIPLLAASVRRLHDRNWRGWWLITPPVPFVFLVSLRLMFNGNEIGGVAASVACVLAWAGLSLLIVIRLCQPGTDGPNRFGPDPRQADLAVIFE